MEAAASSAPAAGAAAGGKKPKKAPLSERARSERRLGWLLCAPAAVAMLLVTAYPIIYAFVLSLQRMDLRFPDEQEFVGLSNYADVLTSSLWWTDVFNTLFVTVVSVSVEFVLGMAIALLMHRAIFGRGVVQNVGADPLRHRHGGRGVHLAVRLPAGHRLRQPAPVRRRRHELVRRSVQRLRVIILAEIWKTTPFMRCCCWRAWRPSTDGLYEAAKVDGATAWQRFYRITLPLMKPAILVALLFRTLDAFRIFDTIFIMTRGCRGHRIGVDPRLQPLIIPAQPRPRLGGLGADLPLRDDDRRSSSSRASAPPFPGRSDEVDGERGPHRNGSSGCSAIVVVIFYALFPVLWIVSLSLKTPATTSPATGGLWTPVPSDATLRTTRRCSRTARRSLPEAADQLDRHRPDRDR